MKTMTETREDSKIQSIGNVLVSRNKKLKLFRLFYSQSILNFETF